MADAYSALVSLRARLTAERQKNLETLADGRAEDKHWELVGRCKGIAWCVERIAEQIKSINGDPDGKQQD